MARAGSEVEGTNRQMMLKMMSSEKLKMFAMPTAIQRMMARIPVL